MDKCRRGIIFAPALALLGCGGAGRDVRAAIKQQEINVALSIFPLQMMTRLAHGRRSITMDDGFNASIVTTGLQDIQQSVRVQAAAPCDVALTLRSARDVAEYSHLGEYWAEARNHPNIKWVYLYDEMFWEHGRVEIGANERAITNAARLVRSVGLKSAVTILPEVILDSAFAFGEIDVFDVITVDIYPSLGIGWQTGPYPLDPNPYYTMIDHSVRKLRDMGYAGEIWYVFQAFGDSSDRDLMTRLQLQREALGRAPSLGVTGAVSFGLYDESGTNLAYPLYQGKGTALEPLVMP